jgi:hypothetical protein
MVLYLIEASTRRVSPSNRDFGRNSNTFERMMAKTQLYKCMSIHLECICIFYTKEKNKKV